MNERWDSCVRNRLSNEMGINLKTKSFQTTIDFLLRTLDENNDVKVCGLEWKSRLTHFTQQHAVTQLMSGFSTCSNVK